MFCLWWSYNYKVLASIIHLAPQKRKVLKEIKKKLILIFYKNIVPVGKSLVGNRDYTMFLITKVGIIS